MVPFVKCSVVFRLQIFFFFFSEFCKFKIYLVKFG